MPLHIPGTRALKAFEAAGRHLNFTRAADELGLTPAAVSHQIKEFEDRLGVVLFQRTSRSMRLTQPGEILHAATTEALDGLTRATIRARKSGATQLKVTVPSTIAAKWLVPRIDEFMKLWPDIDVRMDISPNVRDFARDDIDVAIRWGKGNYPGMRADRLFDDTISPVCSPKLLEATRPLREPRDLMNYRLIHVSWSGQGVTWPDWRMWMLAAGIKDFDEGPGLHFADSSPAIQAAIDGLGVVLGDSSLVADDLAAGRLVQPFGLSIKGPPQFAYYIVSPVETAGDPLVRAFREWVLDEATKTPSG